MTGVEHRDAAGEIDVAPAVGVPQQRVFGALDEYRMGERNAARDGSLAACQQ